MDDSEIREKREKLVQNFKGFFSSASENEADLKEQREKVIGTLKQKTHWLIGLVLVGIIWFTSKLRLQNLPLLKDITTGKEVPLALDPHLFLKYARQIVENGAMVAHDAARFVPVGTSTVNYVFMSSFIAYLYKFIHFFFPSVTLEYVTVIYPVICFAIALGFFFLLVRRLFDWKVGLLATLFLGVVPAFLHRTMAGFSDHEALGVMLMFMAMYFYVLGWQAKGMKKTLGWGVLAGLFTGFMGLTWGGWKFLILIISIFVLIEFFFDKIGKKDVYQYVAWVVALVLVTTVWIPMFSISLLLSSFTTGIAFLVLFMLLVHLAIVKYNVLRIKQKVAGKMPLSVATFVISFVLGILLLGVIVGPSALSHKVEEISDNLLHPLGNDRWQLTVAEQHQPYFVDWVAQFGPNWFSVPLFLTLFIVGSVILFHAMVRRNKNSSLLTGAYVLFILAFILSRHSAGSIFNGESTISKVVYLGSLAVFALLAVIFYFKSFYKNQEEYEKILAWEKKFIFVLVWFLIMVIAARGAVRLLFIFAPITALMAAYAVVRLGEMAWNVKTQVWKYVALTVLVLVVFSPFAFPAQGIVPQFTETTSSQAKFSGPSYNQQWQVTGSWVRENVPEDAVFGHWWDYGYWVQNGFGKATVLDGANKIKYWNYLMGRHVLTAQTQEEALEFLKVHDTTHYLIVSDENFDRFSWINVFGLNPQGTQETRDKTILMYQGGYALDDDFVWEGKVYPRQGAGIGAVFLPMQQVEQVVNGEAVLTGTFEQPMIALVHGNERVDLPLECIYVNGQMIYFEQPGYNGCFRLMPTLAGDGSVENPIGAGLFVSEEGVKALWTNLYIFEGNNPRYDTSAFELIYGEDGVYAPLSLYQSRIVGPQKIWQINYPAGFTVDEETTAKYLGGNELLPGYFYDVN